MTTTNHVVNVVEYHRADPESMGPSVPTERAVTVSLGIDTDKILRVLGQRAARSKTGKATTFHGAIVVRVVKPGSGRREKCAPCKGFGYDFKGARCLECAGSGVR